MNNPKTIFNKLYREFADYANSLKNENTDVEFEVINMDFIRNELTGIITTKTPFGYTNSQTHKVDYRVKIMLIFDDFNYKVETANESNVWTETNEIVK